MARVYAEVNTTNLTQVLAIAKQKLQVNQHMPKSYWEYDSVNITWGFQENYEVVRKIGSCDGHITTHMR